MKKILRFGISDDAHGALPSEERSWSLAARRLEERTGEPWATVLDRAWPSSSWAADTEERILEAQPDLVLILCAAFWVSYPSAPLKVRRSRIPGGRALAAVGFWAASKPVLTNRGLFHLARRMVTGEASSAFFFDPEVALSRTEQAIRAVLRHEEVALAVRGPLPLTISASASLRDTCERRRAAFDSGLANLCESLHVEYAGFKPTDAHPPDELAGDRIHVNAQGHARRADNEFELMLRARTGNSAGSRD